MGISVNVGLGTGKEDEKIQVLMQTLQTQMNIWQSYGPQNGLVGMTNIRNTLADILAVGGVKNADRYYMPMDPQREQQLVMQAQQAAQQGQPDPNAALAQAQIQAETILTAWGRSVLTCRTLARNASGRRPRRSQTWRRSSWTRRRHWLKTTALETRWTKTYWSRRQR